MIGCKYSQEIGYREQILCSLYVSCYLPYAIHVYSNTTTLNLFLIFWCTTHKKKEEKKKRKKKLLVLDPKFLGDMRQDYMFNYLDTLS